MSENLVDIQCPCCYAWFSFALQEVGDSAVEMDYDCEVCCNPMRVIVTADDAYVIGMDE